MRDVVIETSSLLSHKSSFCGQADNGPLIVTSLIKYGSYKQIPKNPSTLHVGLKKRKFKK